MQDFNNSLPAFEHVEAPQLPAPAGYESTELPVPVNEISTQPVQEPSVTVENCTEVEVEQKPKRRRKRAVSA